MPHSSSIRLHCFGLLLVLFSFCSSSAHSLQFLLFAKIQHSALHILLSVCFCIVGGNEFIFFYLEVCDSSHCILLGARHIGKKVHQLTHILHASVSADKTCAVVTEVIIMQAFDIFTIWSFNNSYNLQQCFQVRFWSVGNSILTPWQGISQIVQPNTYYWSVFALRELP